MDFWGILQGAWTALTSDTGIETLKTVFDGILGASLGALVAAWVLKRTLREQRRALSAQLEKQEEHLSKQLQVQEHSLAEQLEAQSAENIRQRERDVASAIIGLLIELHPASQVADNESKIVELGNLLMVNITRLRLDCRASEEPFCDILGHWARYLTERARDISADPDQWQIEPDFVEVTEIQRAHAIQLFTDWCRGNHQSRLNITKILSDSLELNKKDGWRVWRLQIAPETLNIS